MPECKGKISMERVEEKEAIVLEVEGYKLFGVLHLPLKGEKVPGILMCHGLAGNKIGRFRTAVTLAKELAKRGIASLRIDFRGCGDSDGDFCEASVKGLLKDAGASLSYLQKHARIDPYRLGVMGRSFGAAIALMAAHSHKNIKSLALWAPLYNTAQWQEAWRIFHDVHTPAKVREQLLSIEGQQGSPIFFEEFFNVDLAPTLEALADVPLLHIHGLKDSVVKVDHANLYENKRSTARATSKFIKIPKGDHHFTHKNDQELVIAETVNWFKATL
ncbi:hypothetical protein DB42_BV00090 [Neochlamydia sp. EPS4]|nr:hypothetical protein DB42_BV00090 [Neochlamydia sp. EPS4]